jgi:hypothetical protein
MPDASRTETGRPVLVGGPDACSVEITRVVPSLDGATVVSRARPKL